MDSNHEQPSQSPNPVVVSLGVLTRAEFSQHSPAEQASIEEVTQDLLAKYGPEFFTRERDRLRGELSFCYGILNLPFVWWSPSFQREQRRKRTMNTACAETLRVYYSPDYCAADVDFDTTRKSGWIADSLERRPISGVVLAEPEPLTVGELEQVHDPAYVEAVRTGEPRWLAESSGLTWDAGLAKAVNLSNGGAVAAALEAVTMKRNTGSLSSGLHHATSASGAGFCTFNGLALAVRAVIDAGAKRILIIDVDAHCGGGTYSIVRDWPGVVHLDVAVSPFDSYQPEPDTLSTLDIVTNAAQYLPTLTKRLAALDGEQFDIVLLGAGVDCHEANGGPRGIDFHLLAEREALIFRWANQKRIPIAFALLGGYRSETLDERGVARLHRLAIAAAATANAGRELAVRDIMEAASDQIGTEGFKWTSTGHKDDTWLLPDDEDDPWSFDLDEWAKLSPASRKRFSAERHDRPHRQNEFIRELIKECGSNES